MRKLGSMGMLLVAAVALSSCAKNKVTRTFRPPSVPAPVVPNIPEVPPPPEIASAGPMEMPNGEALSALTPVLQPPEVRRIKRRAAAPGTNAPAGAAPLTEQPLRLGAMFTPEQQQQLKNEISGNVSRARRNMASILRKRLNADQKETADQIEVFLKQAQATAASDLEAARSLSERAELLSRDLLRSLR